jgi:hypothetical protein
MSTTIGLAIPQPSQLVDVVNLCQSIEAQLPYVEDVGQLKDAAAKLRAIDEYVALTSSEGRQAIAATVRRIEMRYGEVLGDAVVGVNQYSEGLVATNPSSITKIERYEVRLMAAHPDIVEQEIAKGTDERPTSRRQVLHAIKEHKAAQRAADAAEDAAEREWAAKLTEGHDIEADRRMQKIHLAIIGVGNAIEQLDQFTAEEVAWAVNRALPHVRAKMIERLQRALETLERKTR